MINRVKHRRTITEANPYSTMSSRETPGWPNVILRYGILILITSHLLFAHGCHGDEDNELFTTARNAAVALAGLDGKGP